MGGAPYLHTLISSVPTAANAGYYATAALAAVGAEAVFVDVDDTLTMSPSALAAVIDDVQAVVVTHLYGRLAHVDAIVAVASQRNIAIIEDCAHAHGAIRNGKRAGSFGIAGCFSFYPTKNLGALGDGGAIVTSDVALARRVRALRQHGWQSKYVVQYAGGRNSRLDEMQAAFLRVKLPALRAQNAARASIARHYRRALLDLGVLLPDAPDGEYVAHLFVIRAHDRALLQSRLSEAHIESAIHYPVPDYRQPVCPFAQRADLSVTEAACRDVLSLPCYPGLSQADAERVIGVVREHCLLHRRFE